MNRHARNEAMKERDHAPLRDAIIAIARETSLKVLLCPEDSTQESEIPGIVPTVLAMANDPAAARAKAARARAFVEQRQRETMAVLIGNVIFPRWTTPKTAGGISQVFIGVSSITGLAGLSREALIGGPVG